jgi:hypothetical protein
MVFGLSSSEPQAIHQRSSAIGRQFSTKTEIWKSQNQDKTQMRTKIAGFLVSRLPDARLRMAMEL